MQQFMNNSGQNQQLDIDYMLQTGNPQLAGYTDTHYLSTMTQRHSKSLRAIIEDSKGDDDKRPQRFGLHQLRDNI